MPTLPFTRPNLVEMFVSSITRVPTFSGSWNCKLLSSNRTQLRTSNGEETIGVPSLLKRSRLCLWLACFTFVNGCICFCCCCYNLWDNHCGVFAFGAVVPLALVDSTGRTMYSSFIAAVPFLPSGLCKMSIAVYTYNGCNVSYFSVSVTSEMLFFMLSFNNLFTFISSYSCRCGGKSSRFPTCVSGSKDAKWVAFRASTYWFVAHNRTYSSLFTWTRLLFVIFVLLFIVRVVLVYCMEAAVGLACVFAWRVFIVACWFAKAGAPCIGRVREVNNLYPYTVNAPMRASSNTRCNASSLSWRCLWIKITLISCKACQVGHWKQYCVFNASCDRDEAGEDFTHQGAPVTESDELI